MSSDDQANTIEALKEAAKFEDAHSVDQLFGLFGGALSMCWDHPEKAGNFHAEEAEILVEGAIARLAELSGGTMMAGGPRYQFPEGFEIVDDSVESHSRYEILRPSGTHMRVHPSGRGLKDDYEGWTALLELLKKECFEDWGVVPKIKLVHTQYHYVQANKIEEIQ
ncbi:hypothetical protein PBI_SUZY_85 [Gordonia phage Suzy]|uniref:Uncharacterized protein n=1 Tax=Gordonia phage Suzy TaxID=2201430 RepID=A0A2Z4Q8T2_9CAUD|nr:hypothetical protein HOT44_gp85 [Gordonia phage Suzy]AWY06189.1 hypothetical protein PBI_SUZY_85 [Gordonia phage Suzy]